MSESVLTTIRKKEIELQALLLEARRQAELIVAAATDEAAALRREAEQAAEAEARRLRDSELAETRRQVEEILAARDRRLAALDTKAACLAELTELIVAAVAPRDDLPPTLGLGERLEQGAAGRHAEQDTVPTPNGRPGAVVEKAVAGTT